MDINNDVVDVNEESMDDTIETVTAEVEEVTEDYSDMQVVKSWDEFKESGLLWFINTILQVFGWSIILDINKETNEITTAYPVRTKYRGFSDNINNDGYIRVSRFLYENIDDLLDEAEEN